MPEKGVPSMTQTMTSRDRVLATIDHRPTDRVPTALGLSYFTARHHGVPIADIIADPMLFQELKRQTFEDLGGSDLINLMPPCLGNSREGFRFMPVKVRMPGADLPPDVIPQYDEVELMTAEDYPYVIEHGWFRFAEDVLIPRVFPPEAGQSRPAYDDSRFRRYYEERDVFIMPGNAILLPFEVLSFARSFEKFLLDLYRRPDVVIAALEAIMPEVIETTLAGITEDTREVTIPANRESSGFISPQFFEKFAFPQLLTIVRLMVERGLTVFFHLDQDWTKVLPYFRQFPEGRYVLHFDSMTDLFKAKELLGDRMCLMGDVPARLFSLGTPATIEAYCKRLIDEVGKGGGFILGAG
jgi:uroporphyrinogen-III decarboxylase